MEYQGDGGPKMRRRTTVPWDQKYLFTQYGRWLSAVIRAEKREQFRKYVTVYLPYHMFRKMSFLKHTQNFPAIFRKSSTNTRINHSKFSPLTSMKQGITRLLFPRTLITIIHNYREVIHGITSYEGH